MESLFVLVRQPPVGQGLLIHEVSRSHTTTHHSRQDSSGRVISSSQRPLPDNSQQTNIHAPGGIRTHNLSRRATADVPLRPPDYWDRQMWKVHVRGHSMWLLLCLFLGKSQRHVTFLWVFLVPNFIQIGRKF